MSSVSLKDFPPICQALKCVPTKSVKLLFSICFNDTFDRSSRTKLRNFQNFPPTFDLKSRKENILKTFSLNDFICVANILHIDSEGSATVLCDKIFDALSNLTSFQPTSVLFDDDDELPALTFHSDSQTETASLATCTQAPNGSNKQLFENESFAEHANLWLIIREVSHSIRKFSGNNSYTVNTFLREIEDNLYLLPPLTDQHKVIFVKNNLAGPAKLFIQSQRNLKTWSALKNALIEEFGAKITSADLHRQLRNRKLKPSESLLEYLIALRELAAQGSDFMIDDASIIEYCINNIPDAPCNKLILYGCTNISEFKQKLKIYEKIFERHRYKSSTEHFGSSYVNRKRDDVHHKISNPRREAKSETFRPHAPNKQIVCYNCNDFGHLSKFCPDKNRGPKCLSCGNFGHKSTACHKSTDVHTTGETHVNALNSTISHLMYKTVTLEHVSFNALIDTGSQATILLKRAYLKIGSPALHECSTMLTAFGNGKIKPLGYFESRITIDSQIFTTDVCVVDDGTMPVDLIIGMNVLSQAELTITPAGLSIHRHLDVAMNEDVTFISNISVTDDFSPDIGPTATKHQRDTIQQLVTNYRPNKVKTTNIEMTIQFDSSTPVRHRPRRLPFTERDIVDKQVDTWIKDGIIEPCSSDYSSQVVLVKKKDGTPRLCVDYRQLNKHIVKDRYPLPLIDDLLDKLQNARIFSTIDLKNGFFHVNVHKDSRRYTSFVTHSGQFQFLKVPFGLCISPSVFQRFINTVFKDLILSGQLLLYMDDLIIPAKDEEENIERLKSVFSIASDYGLEINFKKCKFLHKKIEFLGHIIQNGQLFPSPQKTAAVLNYPEPKNQKDVQSFLGLAGYFRKFIQNFSIIARPLSNLLKKSTVFHFGVNEKNAFNQLKQSLANKPVLHIYNQNSETELHTDACINGFGCILLQKSTVDQCFHPVYFLSKCTSDAERNYSSYELEMLAVIYAVKKFRVYLLGKKFKIVTDCNAFKLTMSKRDLSAKIARWALLLEDYNYTIEHRTGAKMAHVDALSRYPTMLITTDSLTLQIQNAQSHDPNIQAIKEVLKTKQYDDYFIKANILYKLVDGYEVLVVPDSMQDGIIKDTHENGHFASKKVEEQLKQHFYIPNLKDKIARCIANCVPCILTNRKRGKQEGLLHPLPKEDTPLHTYHIDHLGPLATTSKRYQYIFAVIDSFTKFVWLYPTKSTDAAEVLAKLDHQKQVFGNPVRIISDRGSAFLSNAFKDYCDHENIQHLTITTGLPRANGQVERLNSIIISVLSKLSVKDPTKWYAHVAEVQQIVNSTFQRSIKTTPFELLFGTKMRVRSNLQITDLLNAEIQSDFVNSRDDLRKDAKQQILKVQDENRKTYNLRRKKPSKFNLHDLVAVKRTQLGPGLKLYPKFLGPYKIIRLKPNDTYDVEKCGQFDGPMQTSTCIEFMKPWTNNFS